MTQPSSAFSRLLVSAVIVAILSVQAVAGFVDTGRWGYPILAYPMYKTARYDGDRLDHHLRVFAVKQDASRVEVKPEDLNMSFWLYWYNVVQPVRHSNFEVLKPVIDRYCQESEGEVIKLQAEDLGIAIGRDGPVEGLPPEVQFETDVSC